eukprot:GHVT01026115.1.p5 GENE.GHVT01026115.1~~GHVT01026115.1.p5  ORF type:complete len:118 (-),score=41.97 GHVT01026115.1:600-953(-)
MINQFQSSSSFSSFPFSSSSSFSSSFSSSSHFPSSSSSSSPSFFSSSHGSYLLVGWLLAVVCKGTTILVFARISWAHWLRDASPPWAAGAARRVKRRRCGVRTPRRRYVSGVWQFGR